MQSCIPGLRVVLHAGRDHIWATITVASPLMLSIILFYACRIARRPMRIIRVLEVIGIGFVLKAHLATYDVAAFSV